MNIDDHYYNINIPISRLFYGAKGYFTHNFRYALFTKPVLLQIELLFLDQG